MEIEFHPDDVGGRDLGDLILGAYDGNHDDAVELASELENIARDEWLSEKEKEQEG